MKIILCVFKKLLGFALVLVALTSVDVSADSKIPYDVNLTYGSVIHTSLGLGFILPLRRSISIDGASWTGPAVVAEVGECGGILGAGYGWKAETNLGNFGLSGTVSYLKTRDHPSHVDPDEELVGVEVRGLFMVFFGKIGYFVPLEGDDDTVSLAIGIGF